MSSSAQDHTVEQAVDQLVCDVCQAVYRSGFPRCPKDGGILKPLVTDPLEDTLFAERYLMEHCVGEGAMGRVYRARHARMSGRIFAVKVMFGDLAADGKMRSRFEHEAEVSSRLSHENLVSVIDFGETPGGLLYLVMDFIEGANLADILEQQGQIPEDRAVRMLAGITEGLEHAHGQGLIHRDLKTENIVVVEENGREIPKIVDFGIARTTELETGEQRLTAQGCVVGTPAYMSPEQACGEEIDTRTDMFSLGLIMYELLSGKKPFDGSPMEVARQNISATAPPINHRTPGTVISPELEQLVSKLMAKQKEDRPATAHEVLAKLEEIYGQTAVYGARKRPRRMSETKRQPSDAMLAALSLSSEQTNPKLRAGTSMTAALEQAGIGGGRRAAVVVAILAVLLLGFGAYSWLGGSSKPQVEPAVPAEPLAGLVSDDEAADDTEADAEDEADESDPGLEEDDSPEAKASPKARRPKKTSRRVRRPKKRVERSERAEAPQESPVAKSAPPPPVPEKVEPKLPPVSTSEFSRKYIEVGSLVDRLAREKGKGVAGSYSGRYLRVNLNDSLRLEELRSRNMAELKKLEAQINKKLQ